MFSFEDAFVNAYKANDFSVCRDKTVQNSAGRGENSVSHLTALPVFWVCLPGLSAAAAMLRPPIRCF
jgi:hypothetical protein